LSVVGSDESEGRRRFDVTRTLTLADGVFAISLTLLVLALVVPRDLPDADAVNRALGDLTANFLALALSFSVVGRFWIGHHQTFRLIDAVDIPLMWLNIAFLAWIALMPFSTSLVASYGEFAVPTIVYAANIAGAALSSAAIHWWAITHGRHQGAASRVESGTLTVAAVFLVSILVTVVVGPGAGKYTWLATPVAGVVLGRLKRSRGTAGR
jgi:uncharacterized membrane protein